MNVCSIQLFAIKNIKIYEILSTLTPQYPNRESENQKKSFKH